jgi:hypothetical protein
VTAPFPPEPDRDILESSPRWERAVSLLERVPRWLMLTAAAVLLAGGGAWLALGAGGQARPSPARPAARAVSVAPGCGVYDNGTRSHVPGGFRTVFGDVAVPPARLPVSISGRSAPWEWGAKTAFYYRGGGPPVTISVPGGWQRKIGLFGPVSQIDGMDHTVNIPGCPPRGSWDFYVSSFYLRTPTACAPLDVRVGGRIAQFWFGLGVSCPAGADTGPRIPTYRISAAP